MPANLPAHIVSNIKTLNEIPALGDQLKYLGDSTQMEIICILTPHLNKWVVCMAYNTLNLNIVQGTAMEFNSSNKELEENTILMDNMKDAKGLNISGQTNLKRIQKLISQPIHRLEGKFFGLLCALGTDSTFGNDINLKQFYNFHSRFIATSIGLVERSDEFNHHLRHEIENAEKHSTYMAVLGHDLRNPVATVRMCSDIILKAGPNSVVSKNAGIIKSSSYRMQELIDSMLDTAQSKFGDGIKIEKKVNNVLLANALYHVVDEIMAVNYLEIKTSLKLTAPVNCDVERIAQLVSNLLSNAVNHGDGKNILMDVRTIKNAFVLTVSNTGPTIPKAKLKKIFEPYYSDFTPENKGGLGLGLYISSQIAQSHGGSLKVKSNAGETKFILTIPL